MGGETLGRRLALIRGKRGLSQLGLAKLTGLKVQNISRLETESREHVRSDTLVRLATALGVSADYLLGLTDAPSPRPRRPRRRRGVTSADEETDSALCGEVHKALGVGVDYLIGLFEEDEEESVSNKGAPVG